MLEDARDRALVQELRRRAGKQLSVYYDTDFNLVRFLQGHNGDIDLASKELLRHLQFRRLFRLDSILEERDEHPVLGKYFPLGFLGDAGRDNALLVVECAGRIDLTGILRSVRLSDFILERFRFQERMLAAINAVETRTGRQSAVVYVLDLEGLKFEPSLLSIVTGPYRILWECVYTNYPEWISFMHIVNAPPFMSLLWKAIAPLIPERTRSKVHIHTTGSSWRHKLLEHASPDRVPVHWGGERRDSFGDPMCREWLQVPTDLIPAELYLPADGGDGMTPRLNQLETVVVPARQSRRLSFRVKPAGGSHGQPLYLVLYRYAERTYNMALYCRDDEDDEEEDEGGEEGNSEGDGSSSSESRPHDKVDERALWHPAFNYPAMPTIDRLRLRLPSRPTGSSQSAAQVVDIVLDNSPAWLRSYTVHVGVQLETEDGRPLTGDGAITRL